MKYPKKICFIQFRRHETNRLQIRKSRLPAALSGGRKPAIVLENLY
ncbi:hypothetical protein [Parabacteroides bouchesdurhonensis]|nr:hypothetical protein [Parabacteroides bouchesdurhonensis]